MLIGVRAEVLGGLADHGHAAEILAHGLDRGERAFEQLPVLHRRENLFDENVLRNAEIGRVVEHIVDAPQQPHHQRLDQVGVLLVVDALEVEALQARKREAVFHVVEDGVVDALPTHFERYRSSFFGRKRFERRRFSGSSRYISCTALWITSSSSGSSSAPPLVKQQLDERIEERDVALGRLQRERD